MAVHVAPHHAVPDKQQLRTVIPVIVRWYDALPAGDKYLLAGIKVGWEASIGWNAYYYPGGNAFLSAKNHSDAHRAERHHARPPIIPPAI